MAPQTRVWNAAAPKTGRIGNYNNWLMDDHTDHLMNFMTSSTNMYHMVKNVGKWPISQKHMNPLLEICLL